MSEIHFGKHHHKSPKDFGLCVVYLDKHRIKSSNMKKILCLALGLLSLSLTPGLAQPRPLVPLHEVNMPPESHPKLTRFDLNFPGGRPRDLVSAITKATGQPLNVIISDEDNDSVMLPALKMSDIDVSQLFSAVEMASAKKGMRPDPGRNSYVNYTVSYGFSVPNGSGISDNTIWYFHVDKPPQDLTMDQNAKAIRFYNLEGYLNRGFTVDDITTAIKTGWKIAGMEPAPELNYHKETKMLIAFDEPRKLSTIEQVLNALPTRKISYDELVSLSQRVSQLKDAVADLQKKIDSEPPKPAASTQEKSEK